MHVPSAHSHQYLQVSGYSAAKHFCTQAVLLLYHAGSHQKDGPSVGSKQVALVLIGSYVAARVRLG